MRKNASTVAAKNDDDDDMFDAMLNEITPDDKYQKKQAQRPNTGNPIKPATNTYNNDTGGGAWDSLPDTGFNNFGKSKKNDDDEDMLDSLLDNMSQARGIEKEQA